MWEIFLVWVGSLNYFFFFTVCYCFILNSGCFFPVSCCHIKSTCNSGILCTFHRIFPFGRFKLELAITCSLSSFRGNNETTNWLKVKGAFVCEHVGAGVTKVKYWQNGQNLIKNIMLTLTETSSVYLCFSCINKSFSGLKAPLSNVPKFRVQ